MALELPTKFRDIWQYLEKVSIVPTSTLCEMSNEYLN